MTWYTVRCLFLSLRELLGIRLKSLMFNEFNEFYSHPFLEFTDRMTYRERMTNIFFHYFEDIMFQIYHYPLQGAIYDKFFKADKPSFKHMLKHSVSLVLLNTHYSLNYPQAYLPNMVKYCSTNVSIKNLLN